MIVFLDVAVFRVFTVCLSMCLLRLNKLNDGKFFTKLLKPLVTGHINDGSLTRRLSMNFKVRCTVKLTRFRHRDSLSLPFIHKRKGT